MTTSADIVNETLPSDAERNMGLIGAFTRTVLKDPSVMDNIPQGATLIFLPEDDPTTVETNIRLGLGAVRLGDDVFFLHVGRNEDGTLRIRGRGERNMGGRTEQAIPAP